MKQNIPVLKMINDKGLSSPLNLTIGDTFYQYDRCDLLGRDANFSVLQNQNKLRVLTLDINGNLLHDKVYDIEILRNKKSYNIICS